MPNSVYEIMQMLGGGSAPGKKPYWDGQRWVYSEPYNPYGPGGEGLKLRMQMDPSFAAEMAKQGAWGREVAANPGTYGASGGGVYNDPAARAAMQAWFQNYGGGRG